jgi:hypothetical protein
MLIETIKAVMRTALVVAIINMVVLSTKNAGGRGQMAHVTFTPAIKQKENRVSI